MTEATQNGAEPEQKGVQPDAPLPPRVQQVADLLAEVIARGVRESRTEPEL